jgi:hypothetical protein
MRNSFRRHPRPRELRFGRGGRRCTVTSGDRERLRRGKRVKAAGRRFPARHEGVRHHSAAGTSGAARRAGRCRTLRSSRSARRRSPKTRAAATRAPAPSGKPFTRSSSGGIKPPSFASWTGRGSEGDAAFMKNARDFQPDPPDSAFPAELISPGGAAAADVESGPRSFRSERVHWTMRSAVSWRSAAARALPLERAWPASS